jgi:chromosome segregation protein
VALGETLEQGREALHRAEDMRDQYSAQINAAQQRLSELKAQHGGQQARLEQMSVRARRLLAEYGELAEHIQRDESELDRARASLLEAESRGADLAGKRDSLAQARDQARERLEHYRRQWQQAKDRQHQVAARLQAMRTDVARVRQGMARLEASIEQSNERRFDLQNALNAQQSVDDWQNQYLVQQARQQELQNALEQAREALQQADSQLRGLEEEKRRLDRYQEEQRNLLEETRLALQSNLARRQSIEEQLVHAPWPVAQLLAELPPEANESAWLEGIQDVESRLQKLGSINMAALEEYEEQDGRKKYLDEQFGDLDTALNLLQKAIDEIDTETRNRFLQTLNKVDEGFRQLFPHIFGGGEAYLKLTSEDVLTAGVMVMARPPGKRNSTIHLLSGGEKALTAVALVFAIFELNPAPFCMLDEVDAPLDDTNVGRYCKLVTKMSEHVQFIFITHNKIAMEMADQLLGVTMQEPGVSRPVSVDIDLAVEMVGV